MCTRVQLSQIAAVMLAQQLPIANVLCLTKIFLTNDHKSQFAELANGQGRYRKSGSWRQTHVTMIMMMQDVVQRLVHIMEDVNVFNLLA